MASFFEFFIERKKTEHVAVYAARFIFAFILFLLMIAYFVIGILNIINEIPTIRLNVYNANTIPVPSLKIVGSFVYDMDCNMTNTSGGSVTVDVCSNTFAWVVSDTDSTTTSGYFFPNSSQNFVYNPVQANSEVVIRVITGDNSTFNSSVTRRDLTVVLYDQSLSPIHFVTTAPDYQGSASNRTSFDQTFLTSLDSLNVYTLSHNRTHFIGASRYVRKLMTTTWLNYFGIPPTYEVDPFIQTSFRSVAISDADYDPTVFCTIQLTAQSFEINTQQEIKDKTVLTLLGLMGGAIGIAASIYYFLFGVGRLYPWGFVQSYGCCFSTISREKLKENFGGNGDYQPVTSSTSQNLDLDNLNLLLRDYVVDVSYLDQSIRSKNRFANKGDGF